MKIGYNPNDSVQFEKAMNVYEEFGLLTAKGETYPYLCYISRSILADEIKSCMASYQ